MATLTDAVARDLGVAVVGAARLGGGDVAESYRMELADGRTVFAKTHRAPPAGFFTTEAAGLEHLRAPDVMPVPEVLAVSDGNGDDVDDGDADKDRNTEDGGSADSGSISAGHGSPPRLVLEWIDEGGRSTPDDEHEFGARLARLHRAGTSCFGRDDRRSTGSLGLPNDPCEHWADFFAERRLHPLARIARDRGSLPTSAIDAIERTTGRLSELGVPTESPARLHGDLWAGNRVVDTAGRSWLIDPAFHGGHREFDLAMMRLFGGFGANCFDGYDMEWPLADGWEQRVPLHQLAPLTVHAIKFGGGYVDATQRALDAVDRLG